MKANLLLSDIRKQSPYSAGAAIQEVRGLQRKFLSAYECSANEGNCTQKPAAFRNALTYS
jgi:hypothetical protein